MLVIEKVHKIKRFLVREYQKRFTVVYPETYILSDAFFIKQMFRKKMKQKLNLRNPKTFCEKQNWLKLYDRRSIYTMMVDKYMVRDFVAQKVGEEYLVPLIGVWDDAEKIDFVQLPDKFVLKCNHNSDVFICTDKSVVDIEVIQKKMKAQLSDDYYLRKREWPYKNVKRRIICEKYMENFDGSEPLEYKVFCFGGVPKYIIVISGRFSGRDLTMDTYDEEWHYTDLINGDCPRAGNIYLKPDFLEEILTVSRNLSENIPFVRVDFNYWNRKLYFGELTFFDAAGFEKYQPESWDYHLGSLIELPKKCRRKLWNKNGQRL